MMNRCTLLLALSVLLPVFASAYAQGDLEAKRQSLDGVSSFAVTTITEGPRDLTESDVVGASVVASRVSSRLHEAGLPVATGADSIPALHVHLNMMALENGLIPFSIEIAFYQDVRLERNGERIKAATWNESVVGLVSQDMLSTVGESIDSLVDQFIQDFRAAN